MDRNSAFNGNIITTAYLGADRAKHVGYILPLHQLTPYKMAGATLLYKWEHVRQRQKVNQL